VALARRNGPPRPLLWPAGRLLAAALIAASVVTTVALGAWIQYAPTAGSLNDTIDAKVISVTTGHDHLLHLIESLGDWRPQAVLAVVIALCCLAAREWRGMLLAVVAIPLAGGLTEYVLKPVISGESWASFPSGHTTGSFAVAAVVAVLAAGPAGRHLAAVRVLAAIAALGLLLLAIAMTVAMIGLAFHFFTDTVGGAAVGVTVVLSTALAIDALAAVIRLASGRVTESSLGVADPGPAARAGGQQR
jgi:membrane-associated phospholipid phosphatase